MKPDEILVAAATNNELVAIFRDAIRRHEVPIGWRQSEYAMTKMAAGQAAIDLVAEGKTTLFRLQCLIGEIARYSIARGHSADLVACFQHLKDAIAANPEAARYVKAVEMVDIARAKANSLRVQAEELRQQADAMDRVAGELKVSFYHRPTGN